jgi:hypothetical protein
MRDNYKELRLPPGSYLEWDPDVLVLRRGDDKFVAAFSTCGATKEAIEEAAWQDYRGQAMPDSMEPNSEKKE